MNVLSRIAEDFLRERPGLFLPTLTVSVTFQLEEGNISIPINWLF